jgi:hypothetical protein
MPVLRANIIGSPVVVYDDDGNRLAHSEVLDFNKTEMRLEVDELPDSIATGEVYDLLIICAPTPWEYKGRVLGSGLKREFALFQGKQRDSRGARRFKVDFHAGIEAFVSEGQIFALHKPVGIRVVNISKTGLRFVAKHTTLKFGDVFHMRMALSDSNEKQLEAEVVNTNIKEDSTAEYGCRFISEGGVSGE